MHAITAARICTSGSLLQGLDTQVQSQDSGFKYNQSLFIKPKTIKEKLLDHVDNGKVAQNGSATQSTYTGET